MVGEIRDRETAQMAVRSSLTGHLVFSTVHTNDAPSAITRLLDMGIEDYLVAAALKGVLSQRLVRVNCTNCLQSYRPADGVLRRVGLLDEAGKIDFKRGSGCNKCKRTGFRNLTGIFEFVKITPDISELMLSSISLNRIRERARQQGYVPLFEAGLQKVKAGSICLEELLKETSNIEEYFAGDATKHVGLAHAGTV
jgi:type II secretory ATPase GspE/PulE/Tfp pilus assembly ATPase PilB-like protein